MKTPDQIIEALKRHYGQGFAHPCEGCPYGGKSRTDNCRFELTRDALELLEEYENRNEKLMNVILEKERDAAVEAVEMYPCFTCKNISSTYCKDCLRNRSLALDRAGEFLPDNYEWRGFCAENTKEDANA